MLCDNKKNTFHFLCLVLHLGQRLLVVDQLFDAHTQLVLQLLDLRLGLVDFINFRKVVIFVGEIYCGFLCIRFDILLWFVLTMVYFLDLLLQLVNETEGVSFGILFTCANGICNVVLVMGHIPDSVRCSEFISFISFGSEGLYFRCHLMLSKIDTLSASPAIVLFDCYWFTKNMGMDVEYREYIKYLMFILYYLRTKS